MMMAFGTFVFSLPTLAYQELQRSTAWRHEATARIGARPARQFTGPGDDVIQLSGLVAPELTGSQASLDELRALADLGRPQSLVDGTGVVYGAFVITELQETKNHLFADGAARRIEFRFTLTRTDDEAMTEPAPRSRA